MTYSYRCFPSNPVTRSPVRRKRKSAAAAKKKSNTWALVAAVLVATFSLLFNHLFRITPDKVDVMLTSLDSLQEASQNLVEQITASEDPGLRGPKKIVKDLTQLEPILDAYFTAHCQGKIGFDEKIEQAGAVLRSASRDLEQQAATIPAEALREVRIQIFEGLFLLAGMRPDLYSEDLTMAADRILADPELPTAEPFELLLKYHDLRLHADSNSEVLKKLRDYSAQQSDDAFAIKLYAVVASGLKKFDRRHLSSLVLRQGMALYEGHPDRSRLVNVLIDLKIEDL